MWVEILLVLLGLFLYLYYITTKQFDYFEKRGVPFAKPSFPYGSENNKKMVNQEITLVEDVRYLINNGFKDKKIFGFFAFGQPIWVINHDEELAKNIFIKDFDHFTDIRAVFPQGNSKSNRIFQNLFVNLKGDDWRAMRSLVSNIFSSGKMKAMFPHIRKSNQNMEAFVKTLATTGEYLEVKDVIGKCTLDAAATAGFGLEADSFKNPDSHFRKMALSIMGHPDYVNYQMLRVLAIMIFPKLSGFFNINFAPNNSIMYFFNLMETTYKQRLESGQRRNDVIDLLIDEMKAFKDNNKSATAKFLKSEEDVNIMLVANGLMFFIVGIDTVTFGTQMAVHQLVENPEIQERLYEDIVSVLEEHDGEVTYESLQEMKYLDMFISEVGRFHDMINHVERECTKDYKIPGTDYVIEKGRYVRVYVRDFHFSKEYYANPDVFDPENFSKENNPPKFAYHFFGQGPRSCIGMRFALMTLKLQVVHLLKKYRLVKGEKTADKLEVDPKGLFTLKPFYVKVEARN